MSDGTNVAIQQVDSRRRGFLTKLLTGGAALAALPVMSTVALGDEEANGGKGSKGKGGKGKGDGGGQGKGADGQGKGSGRKMDPKKMAAEMLAKYDKDGDKALNEAELVAALTAMAEQRGARGGQDGGGRGKGGGGGTGKGSAGGTGKGKGKGKGNQ